MNSPTFLALFSAVFILLGSYNIYSGFKRIQASRARGTNIIWYKQINILTGVEYILLALVFIISTAVRNKAIPTAFSGAVSYVYIILLLAAAILAGLVIRQGILNARAIRAQSRSSSATIKSNGTSVTARQVDDEEDPQQNAANLERRRERRRNAAAARRRRAGKA
jgi:hypothetical protein